MKNYEECKEIALERAKDFNVTIDKAYKLGNGFVFDNSQEEFIGILPMVIDTSSGVAVDLWLYLNQTGLTMDDMTEIEL